MSDFIAKFDCTHYFVLFFIFLPNFAAASRLLSVSAQPFLASYLALASSRFTQHLALLTRTLPRTLPTSQLAPRILPGAEDSIHVVSVVRQEVWGRHPQKEKREGSRSPTLKIWQQELPVVEVAEIAGRVPVL